MISVTFDRDQYCAFIISLTTERDQAGRVGNFKPISGFEDGIGAITIGRDHMYYHIIVRGGDAKATGVKRPQKVTVTS